MTSIILCPGPSLSRLESLPFCDLSIAVNRAALRFAVDVWASSDYPMIRNNYMSILGTPILLTMKQTAQDLPAFRLAGFPTVKIMEQIEVPKSLGWLNKTMTAAMAYAYTEGAKQIDIYGCDWEGELDYDGTKAGENRSDARWELERADYRKLANWLGERGVEVRRISWAS